MKHIFEQCFRNLVISADLGTVQSIPKFQLGTKLLLKITPIGITLALPNPNHIKSVSEPKRILDLQHISKPDENGGKIKNV